jgi:hypothetical protein
LTFAESEMLGLIQKLLLDLVEDKAGAEGVSEVMLRAGVPPDRVFRIGEAYSDEEWQRLLRAACEVLHCSDAECMDAYAEVFGRDALSRFPKWFEMSANSREFLERQVTIHNVFASGVRDPGARKAVVDKFRIEKRAGEIVTHYRSPNRLCSLYKALARWMFRHYGDEATIEEPKCMLRGDAECELHVSWRKLRAACG